VMIYEAKITYNVYKIQYNKLQKILYFTLSHTVIIKILFQLLADENINKAAFTVFNRPFLMNTFCSIDE
jgi:hypothetical protein